MRISCIGTGYVGLVTGSSLANLGHSVLCADIDAQKVLQLQQGTISFYEPGLQELMDRNVEKNRLRFTSSVKEALQHGEVIFICVGTPSQPHGAADLSAVYAVVDAAGIHIRNPCVLVLKSTVPPGSARECTKRLLQSGSPILIASNPEFLKQGNAVYDFNHPDKIVVGAESDVALSALRKVYQGLQKTYIPYLEMSWETAELVKYANNAFLATKISFINEIANICERTHADIKIVAKALGMDPRIGPKFLNAGIGYGGSCFPKDVRALITAAQDAGYDPRLLKEAHALNERQKEVLVPKIFKTLKEVGGDTVTLWGLSFKPKTSDLRGASSLVLIEKLTNIGYNIKAYDPAAMDEAKKNIFDHVEYCSCVEESVQGSSAIVLVTEWDEFRNVNFADLGKRMKHKILFDGRNIYDPEFLRQEGFDYYGVGR